MPVFDRNSNPSIMTDLRSERFDTLHPEQFYSVDEALPFLGVKRTSCYALINDGQIIARKIGGATRILGRDILDFQRALPVIAPSKSSR